MCAVCTINLAADLCDTYGLQLRECKSDLALCIYMIGTVTALDVDCCAAQQQSQQAMVPLAWHTAWSQSATHDLRAPGDLSLGRSRFEKNTAVRCMREGRQLHLT